MPLLRFTRPCSRSASWSPGSPETASRHAWGRGPAHRTAYLLLAAATACLATAPTLAVTLAGAGMVGLGAGLLLADINRTLTRGGGSLARVRMGRAALVAMLASISVPIIIGVGEDIGLGWQLAFLVAALLILTGLWASRGRQAASAHAAKATGRLPGRYWLAWCLVVLVVSVEFAIVFWASTLVERQVGISLGDATRWRPGSTQGWPRLGSV